MYLITGASGFIGFHVASRLLSEGKEVLGLDIATEQNCTRLTKARLQQLTKHKSFFFLPCDITQKEQLAACLKPYTAKITNVIHLAAQTGIRQSFLQPHSCVEKNILGQVNLLEQFKEFSQNPPLVYASSSSVYGMGKAMPFLENSNTDNPLSLYAATKKAAEIITESYTHLYPLHATGLRLFTVYGPWGRPNMAYYIFTRNIMEGKTITLFNQGNMRRDFTFIDDIVEGVLRVANQPRKSGSSHVIYNLGHGKGEMLSELVVSIEKATSKKAVVDYAPVQPGEMEETCASVKSFNDEFGFVPKTNLREGIARFVEWYKGFDHD